MPPALWAGVILVATSIPGQDLPQTDITNLDKLVHFTLYAVLGALVARALRGVARTSRRALVTAVAGIALFGAADELHQQLVPGRSAEIPDWIADVSGGTVALLLVAAMAPRRETT